ncbi:remodeling and spacing factor 1-like isoform X1 [Cloeon dipterum]|uniref:remodeling and spacing factor 1-like isoform X1 n=1 Tax=Cloeon dipterum TaxID=197152 RepID=UPI00321FDCCE
MASEAEASCISDPNFAVICSFLERFAETCGIAHPDFKDLQQMLENCEQVDTQLIDLHIKLLRKARKSFTSEKWEKALVKFCHIHNQEDATHIETSGYLKVPLSNKVRILKTLLESQFDMNMKFKAAINKLTASELRLAPLGRDTDGQVYWVQQDDSLNIRVYQEDEDEQSWKLVVNDRESLAQLITKLSGGKLGPAELDRAVLDDDSAQSQDDEDEEIQPDDILLDTGQPEDAKPPGLTNGSHKKKKKKHHEKPINEADANNCEEEEKEEEEEEKDGLEQEKKEVAPVQNEAAAESTDLKRKAEDDTPDAKKSKVEVGEAIEEPLMLVQGEGNGADCDAVFGEAIEEPVMFFCGVGSGRECDTGNPGEGKDEEKEPRKDAAQENKNDNSPSKSAVWSIDQICGTSKPSQSSFSMGMMFGNLAKPTFVSSPEKPSFFNVNFAANAKSAYAPESNQTTKTEDAQNSGEIAQCEHESVADVTSQAQEQSQCKEESSEVKNEEVEPVSERVVNDLTDAKVESPAQTTEESNPLVESAEVVPDQPSTCVSDPDQKNNNCVDAPISENIVAKPKSEETSIPLQDSVNSSESANAADAKDNSCIESLPHDTSTENTIKEEKAPEPTPSSLEDETSMEVDAETCESPLKKKGESEKVPSPDSKVKDCEKTEVAGSTQPVESIPPLEGPSLSLKSTPPPEKPTPSPMEATPPEEPAPPVRPTPPVELAPIPVAPLNEDEPTDVDEKIENNTTDKIETARSKANAQQKPVVKDEEPMEVSLPLEPSEEQCDATKELEDCAAKETISGSLDRKKDDEKAAKSNEKHNDNDSKVALNDDKPENDRADLEKVEKTMNDVPEDSMVKTLELNEAKVEEVVKKEPLTVASALTFDYDPPASPEDQLVIEAPQRAMRGRGRPARRKILGNTTPSPDKNIAESPPAKSTTAPRRGRGRGRGRPPGRPKSGRLDALAGESDDSKDSGSPDVAAEKLDEGFLGKRVSRRIALIRQKEEEERKKKEAEALAEMQRKRELDLLRKQQVDEQSSPESSSEPESEASSNAEVRTKRKYTRRKKKDGDYGADEQLKKKKKKKKKHRRRKGGAGNPWESSDSSDSSEESDGLEPEEEDDYDAVPELKSDHEFSPESDLELGPGEEHQPARRARTATAKKEKSQKAKAEEEEEEEDEYRCQKCQSGDRPEMILLCDSCDLGCHTTCLKPELHLVPEGDWYCPPCGQNRLIEKLTSTLRELDKASRKKSNAELRKQRLAYVGISLSNILPQKDEETEESEEEQDDSVVSEAGSELKEALKAVDEEEDNASSGSPTTESSASEEEKSEEDEEMYPLRQRRAAATVKYDFQEYDEMINSAIQDEVDLAKGAGNQGKGKDIDTIVNANEEEEEVEGKDKTFEPEKVEKKVEEKEAVKESESEPEEEDDDDDDDDDDLNKTAMKRAARERERLEIIANANMTKKKQKKKSIACLDISSGDDDHASDEDFVGYDSDFDEDEEEEVSMDSGDSDVVRRRGKKGSGPVRRSNRARQSRYDKEFIDDSEASDESVKAKKSKGGRSKGWLGSDFSESEDSESDDSDWRGKKKKKRRTPARARAPARSKKRGGKKKNSKAPARKRPPPKDSDSDKPVVKKPRPPKADRPKSPVVIEKRTTRGKKINYQEIVGSDSDDAKPSRVKAKKQHFVSDEEDFKPEEVETTPNRNGTVLAAKVSSPVKAHVPPPIQLSGPSKNDKPTVITKVPVTDEADELLIPTTLNPPVKVVGVPLEATTPASIPAAAQYSPNKYQLPATPSPQEFQVRPPVRYPTSAPPLTPQQPLPPAAFRGPNVPLRPRFEGKELPMVRGQYQPPSAYQGPPQPFYYGPEDYYDSYPQETPTTFETPTTAPPQGSTGEDEVGEFGGLVSYFSSQREDDLES